MAGNLHKIGGILANRLRPVVAGHDVKYKRVLTDAPAIEIDLVAGSPPVDHMLVAETGLDISQQERCFVITVDDLRDNGIDYPQIGDIIVDVEQSNAEFKVLPMGSDYAWKWFNQSNTSFLVKTKQDSLGT